MNSDTSTLGLFTRNSPFIQARSYFGSKSHSSYLCEDLSKTHRNVIGWYYRFGRTTDTGSIFGVESLLPEYDCSYCFSLQARLHSREKRLLLASRPFVCLSLCISVAPNERISVEFDNGGLL